MNFIRHTFSISNQSSPGFAFLPIIQESSWYSRHRIREFTNSPRTNGDLLSHRVPSRSCRTALAEQSNAAPDAKEETSPCLANRAVSEVTPVVSTLFSVRGAFRV